MNWSLKHLLRLIVTSNAYRQSSSGVQVFGRSGVRDSIPQSQIRTPHSVDPENRLLWRQNRRRLDAEALRDSILKAAGTLNPEGGGPSVRVPLEPEVYATIFTEGEPDNLWPVTADPRKHARRSLYLYRKRNVRLPMLAVFDAPDMMSSCAARGESVHALQSLTLMNSDWMLQQSRSLASRLLREVPLEEGRRIERLFLLTLGRLPRREEAAATERFLREQTVLIRERQAGGEPVARLEGLPAGADPVRAAAWADLCLAAFNMNEFVYAR